MRTFFPIALWREGGRERNIDVRDASMGCLLYVPGLRVIHAWTGDRTCSLSMCPGRKSNPTSFQFMG